MLDDVDLVLLMSVNPGFGGQAIIEASVERCRRLPAIRGDRPVLIEIDGGVGSANAERLVEARANVLVGGSTVFDGAAKGRTEAAYAANISALRTAGHPAHAPSRALVRGR